jgi:hypothetical protein
LEVLFEVASTKVNLINQLKKFQSIFSFQSDIQNSFGDEVNQIRNELYFLSQGKFAIAFLKAIAALFRDLFYCVNLSRKIRLQGDPCYVFCVSLMGSSGWGALDPYFKLLPSSEVIVIKHPRLKGRYGWINPSAPSAEGWKEFLRVLCMKEGARNLSLRNFLIRMYLARATLWIEVWKSTISQLDSIKKIVLHNDFDMFSKGAIKSCQSSRVLTLCIQHGLPTDEFFPTSANSYLVWGQSSARVFEDLDLSCPNLQVGRLMSVCEIKDDYAKNYPQEIALVSQTHTPVFGIDLAEKLVALSLEIAEEKKEFNWVSFTILLHPEECRVGNPYLGGLKKLCSMPPHKKMIRREGQDPIIVIGFCSTALIEAALSGNYILGLDWEVNASFGAYKIGAPPVRVKSAQEIFEVIGRLKSDVGYREFFLSKQGEWISNTFNFLNKKSALELIKSNL